jgi:23S rRNA (cytosine1962-C5)-methyltransferase
MRTAGLWKDYELIDCSDGCRLERWNDIVLIRPDPQVIWKTPKEHPLWNSPHAVYHRSSTGGGNWEIIRKMPDVWQMGYGELTFNIKAMGFKHTGLSPSRL